MDYNVGTKERIQIPLEIVRFSKGSVRIGREKYGADRRGFDLDLAQEMFRAGVRAGREYHRDTGREPGSIRVFNLQSHLEIDVN